MNAADDADFAIRCVSLGKIYGDVEALKDLDLSIPRGSVFGFLGRNGAGKTTTIRLLTGLAHPTSGTAWINGHQTTNSDSAARSHFGYLPQDPAFYKWMTPEEYLDHVGRLFQMPADKRRQRAGELLELVGLEKAARRKIGTFSGGMVQRLGIAQALVHNPPVLLLDEPTSALDPSGRYDVLDLIDRLRGEVTIFLSSHILGDVERVCDTIGIIQEGTLLLVAEREELLSRYAGNSVLLAFEPQVQPMLEDLAAELQQLDGVTSVRQSGAELRVAVSDKDKARQPLLQAVLRRDLPLQKYDWVRPSLEEVFLAVSGAEKS